jgi:hypothetical protein
VQYLRTLVHLGTILRNSVRASEIEAHAFATTYEHPFLLSQYCEFENLASFASASKTIEWIIQTSSATTIVPDARCLGIAKLFL